MSGDPYSDYHVEVLVGLHEDPGPRAERDITIADLLSWSQDPGGDFTWTRLHEFDTDGWMARRGPLAPDSELGTILLDFMRAMPKLSLRDQAAIALTAMGFDQWEVAAILRVDRSSVSHTLHGRKKRDAQGQPVRDDEGHPVYIGSAVHKLAAHMRGHAKGQVQ